MADEEPDERCALCGADQIWKRTGLPDEWTTYLRGERGLAAPEGYYLVPLCDDCDDEVAVQKQLTDVAGMDDDARDLLDDLALEALVEEEGA